jgi:hypothetical protein
VVKSSLLFSEGLSSKWFAEVFYNFSATLRQRTNEVTNPLLAGNQRIDSLSLLFKSDLIYNRAGTSVRYSHRGTNLTMGVALQHNELSGSYAQDEGLPWSQPGQRGMAEHYPLSGSQSSVS